MTDYSYNKHLLNARQNVLIWKNDSSQDPTEWLKSSVDLTDPDSVGSHALAAIIAPAFPLFEVLLPHLSPFFMAESIRTAGLRGNIDVLETLCPQKFPYPDESQASQAAGSLVAAAISNKNHTLFKWLVDHPDAAALKNSFEDSLYYNMRHARTEAIGMLWSLADPVHVINTRTQKNHTPSEEREIKAACVNGAQDFWTPEQVKTILKTNSKARWIKKCPILMACFVQEKIQDAIQKTPSKNDVTPPTRKSMRM